MESISKQVWNVWVGNEGLIYIHRTSTLIILFQFFFGYTFSLSQTHTYTFMYVYMFIIHTHAFIIIIFLKVVQSYLFVTPWTVAHQVPLSMEFSRPEYWNG